MDVIVEPLFPGDEFYNSIDLSGETLRIFADNVLDSFSADDDSAWERRFNKYGESKEFPLTAGIPVGTDPQNYFQELNTEVKRIIDDAIAEISMLILQHGYTSISFRVIDKGNQMVSMDCGHAGPAIQAYITSRLFSL